MSKSIKIAGAIDGELLDVAALSDSDMSYMNFARSEFDKLERLVCQLIIPALGSKMHPAAQDIYRHLEQVRTSSGNFCWRHRAHGFSYDAEEPRSIQSTRHLLQGGAS